MSLSTSLPKHVYAIGRAKTLYVIRRVPEDIKRTPQFAGLFGGKPYWKRSLRCSDWRVAVIAYHEREVEFDRLVAEARGARAEISKAPRSTGRPRLPDEEDFNYIADSVRFSATKARRSAYAKAYASWEQLELQNEFEESQYPEGDHWRRAHDHLINPLGNRDAIDREVVEHAELLGLKVETDDHVSLLRRAVVEGQRRAYHDLTGSDALSPRFDPAAELVRRNPPARRTLGDVLVEYQRAGDHDPKWLATLRANVDEFEEFLGEARPINRVRRADLQRYAEALQRCPANRKQRFPNSTLLEAVAANASRDKPFPSLSRTTIRDTKLAAIQTLFRFAKDQREWLKDNPAERIKVIHARDDDKSKQAFGVSDLNRLFAHPIWAGCSDAVAPYKLGDVSVDDHRRWAPIVLLFTGCRPAELAAVGLADVDVDGAFPHIRIYANERGRIKTSNAKRSIPLVPALGELGFFDYVRRLKAQEEVRLFPGWGRGGTHDNYTQAPWVRAFNRTVLEAQLGEEGAKKFGLYSFRKCFKRLMVGANVPLQIQTQLMGHEPRYDEKAYTQTLPLEDTYAAVVRLSYPNLVVPPLLQSRSELTELLSD